HDAHVLVLQHHPVFVRYGRWCVRNRRAGLRPRERGVSRKSRAKPERDQSDRFGSHRRILTTARRYNPLVSAMDLSPGTRLGPYEIVGPLGSGGMGQVFRARDTRLDRLVAIKLLSEQLTDPSARQRFEREARMASALNHPHIVSVFDVGEFEGRQYLVTELVERGTV